MRENLRLTGDVGHLAAHFYLPEGTAPFPTVVLCHGITSCKENYADIAQFLQREGFAVLAYDCRGHGESEGALDGNAWQDIGTVLNYLKARPEVDCQRIALVGSSMGAHNALRAAAEYPSVRAVVAFCIAAGEQLKTGLLSADYWHEIRLSGGRVRVTLPDYLLYLETVDISDLPARISPRPIFFIHARDDEFVPYTVSERLYAASSQDSRLWLLDSGGHTGPRHDPGVQREVAEWLRAKLGS
ncbi:MAG: alpha/beta fold hydrolase [Chloroflexi bacterium]|nr:alpha/beta fold hydrolase [Chloroflexota bacterium]